MKYSLDCEFIDTPTCSALISLALVNEKRDFVYFEFDYPKTEITPWLKENVVKHLMGVKFTHAEAAKEILDFIGSDNPEIWCYFGAYDWYWFCRLFGGFMNMNPRWPHRFFELADYRSRYFPKGVPPTNGPEHHALNDALSQLEIMKMLKLIS